MILHFVHQRETENQIEKSFHQLKELEPRHFLNAVIEKPFICYLFNGWANEMHINVTFGVYSQVKRHTQNLFEFIY